MNKNKIITSTLAAVMTMNIGASFIPGISNISAYADDSSISVDESSSSKSDIANEKNKVVSQIAKNINKNYNDIHNGSVAKEANNIIESKTKENKDLETASKKLQTEIDKLNTEIEKLNTEKADCENINAIAENITSLEENVSNLESKKSELQNKITDLTKQRDDAQKELSKLNTQKANLESKKSTQENKVQTIQGRVDTAQSRVDEIQKRVDTAQKDVETYTSNVTTATTKYNSAQSSYNDINGKATAFANDMSTYHTQSTAIGTRYTNTVKPALDKAQSNVTKDGKNKTYRKALYDARQDMLHIYVTSGSDTGYISVYTRMLNAMNTYDSKYCGSKNSSLIKSYLDKVGSSSTATNSSTLYGQAHKFNLTIQALYNSSVEWINKGYKQNSSDKKTIGLADYKYALSSDDVWKKSMLVGLDGNSGTWNYYKAQSRDSMSDIKSVVSSNITTLERLVKTELINRESTAKTTMTNAKKDLESANSNLENVKADLDTANSELEAIKNDISEVESSITETQSTYDNAVSEITSANSELATTTSDLNNAKTELTSAKSKLTSAKNSYKTKYKKTWSESRYNDIDSDISNAESSVDTKNNEIDSNATTIKDNESAIETANQTLKDVEVTEVKVTKGALANIALYLLGDIDENTLRNNTSSIDIVKGTDENSYRTSLSSLTYDSGSLEIITNILNGSVDDAINISQAISTQLENANNTYGRETQEYIKETIADLEKKIEDTTNTIKADTTKQGSLNKSVANVKTSIKKSDATLKTVIAKVKKAKSTKKSLDKYKKALTKAKKNLGTYKKKVTSVNSQIAKAKKTGKSINSLSAKKSAYSKKVKTYSSKVTAYSKKIKSLSATYRKYSKYKTSVYAGKVKSYKTKLESLNKQLTNINSQLSKEKISLASYTDQRNTFQEKLKSPEEFKYANSVASQAYTLLYLANILNSNTYTHKLNVCISGTTFTKDTLSAQITNTSSSDNVQRSILDIL